MRPRADAAVDIDLGASTHRLDHFDEPVGGGGSEVELASPVIRDPHRASAVVERRAGVVATNEPLHDERQRRARLGEHGEVLPRERRIMSRRDEPRELAAGAGAEIRRQDIDEVCHHEVSRQPEAVANVGATASEDRRVARDDDGAIARSLRARDELRRELAVGMDVELEPARRSGGGGRDVLERGRRERRRDVERARSACGARRRALATRVGQRMVGGGRDQDR